MLTVKSPMLPSSSLLLLNIVQDDYSGPGVSVSHCRLSRRPIEKLAVYRHQLPSLGRDRQYSFCVQESPVMVAVIVQFPFVKAGAHERILPQLCLAGWDGALPFLFLFRP